MPTARGINTGGVEDVFGLKLALICGPVEGDPYTDRQLARAWEVFGDELSKRHTHPWGRRFDAPGRARTRP
jgi:hypothetical protein